MSTILDMSDNNYPKTNMFSLQKYRTNSHYLAGENIYFKEVMIYVLIENSTT